MMEPMHNRLPTGPGSRGGTWHLAEARTEYYRRYRRDHPDYSERERERMSRRAVEYRRRRDEATPTLTDVLRGMVIEESNHLSMREMARRMAITQTTITRFVRDERHLSGDAMEAVIDYFGLWRITREYGHQGRLARERAKA